jgi:acetolactate synthase-1/2/3 large subunit
MRSGGDLLVDLLRRHQVDAAFGVVSVHNLPLVDAVDRRLRWVATRTEAGALNAADGYARATDGVGCAVTSTGTGAGNAAGALVEALTAGSPVLHITGQIDTPYLGRGMGVIHETRDQLPMLEAVSKTASTLTEDAATELSDLIAEALAYPRGPVSAEWPIDLQYADQPSLPAPTEPHRGAKPATPLDEAQLAAAVELIKQARRPLVWVGGGARWAGPELSALLDSTGAGLLTSNAGRGVIPEDDERVVGNFAATPGCAGLLEQADLLISIGSHFRSNETRTFKLPLPRPHIQIDIDPVAIGRSYPADVGLVGDASSILNQLLSHLTDDVECSAEDSWQNQVAETRASCRAQLRTNIGPYAQICDAIRSVLPRNAQLVRDITIPNSAWGNRLLDVYDPATNIYPRGGGIGQAVGLGIGAAVAHSDRRTMVLIGDGGFQIQVGELSTIAQEQLPITIIVFDDGGYGVLRNMQDQHLGRRAGVDLFTPSMQSLAEAHALPYWRVEDANDFHEAFAAATALPGPSLVHVDCDAIGPMPVPFTPPVHIPSR